jgi:hypothetical protein
VEPEQLRDRHDPEAPPAQRGDDLRVRSERLPAWTAAVVGDDDRARLDLGEHAMDDRRRARLRVVARVDVPHDRRQAERAGGLQHRRVVRAVRRAKDARRVARLRVDRGDRPLQLGVYLAGPGQVRMRVRVVADHVALAQLAQHRRPVGGRDLVSDQEERRRRVVAREHRHERRRVLVGPVVEPDRDLVAMRAVRVSGRPAAATADDPIELPRRGRRRAEARRDQRQQVNLLRRAERGAPRSAAGDGDGDSDGEHAGGGRAREHP